MRARARVVAQLGPDGRTVLTELVSDVPLVLRPTPGCLYVASGAGGPLGGDDLELRVVVEAGATLVVRTVGAMVVLPGSVAAPADVALHATVAGGATFHWWPEPTVVAAGARLRSTTTFELDRSASLRWREVVVLGRHGEGPGDAVLRTSCTIAGRPVLRSETRLGPSWPEFATPAGVDGARAHGTTLVADPGLADKPDEPWADRWSARLPLAGPATQCLALGATATEVHDRLAALR